MKQLYYAILNLVHGKEANIIKVISLTLGLAVSIILFTRIAFELNYDSFYRDADNLYQIKVGYVFDEGKPSKPKVSIGGKFAGAIAESFPNEIESTTVMRYWQGHSFYNGDIRFTPFTLIADTLFFDTMGLEVIKGNPRDLANPDQLFLAESMAKRIFGNEDPVGKILMYDRKTPMIVKGVCQDIPENNSIGNYEVIISFATLVKNRWAYIAWDGGDSFLGYARLRNKQDARIVNERIDRAIARYLPPALGFSYTAEIVPIQSIHTELEDVKKMLWIMVTLALAILLAVTLNYVLISVSSLSYRAKAIGVHKCSGASSGKIFLMFFYETGLIITLSLLCMVFLLLNFQDWIEDTINTSFEGLFKIQHIWASVGVVVFLLVIGSLLPGRMFSAIPVTQVFRRYTESKKGWKRILLFMQFMGVSFIFGVLCIVLMQYYFLTHKDLGYSPERIAYSVHTFESSENVKGTIGNLPFVESIASSGLPLIGGYSGWAGVASADNSQDLFPRYTTYDKDYLSLMGIRLKEGKNMERKGEILVNETFVKQMHWSGSPIGQNVERYGTVTGVMRDFASDDFYGGMEPVAVGFQNECNNCIHVKLKAPFSDNLKKLNEFIKDIYPQEDVVFFSLEEELLQQYKSVYQFRNALLPASITILFIALMGLIGYTADEVRRRSKEIAIRKVNGANVSVILILLLQDVVYIALPAITIGIIASRYVSRLWINMFAERINLSLFLFVGIGILVLVFIISCVVLKAWHIANENPVKSIKSE